MRNWVMLLGRGTGESMEEEIGVVISPQFDLELAAALELAPPLPTFEEARALGGRLTWSRGIESPPVEGVAVADRAVQGRRAAPPFTIRTYRPHGQDGPLPCLYWIHGGGFVMGNLEMDDITLQRIVSAVGCVVVAVDYRLAPEDPFPAALCDCYDGLHWILANARGLSIDASRIAVGGASAGGGLAAGVVLLARDRSQFRPAFQMLIYPMLDDRTASSTSRAPADPRVWNSRANRAAWWAYLGREPGGDAVSPYAAPGRAPDLRDLPPTYIAVGEAELFHDECVEYARRLREACVPTELHVYPGAFHGWDVFVPGAELSRRLVAEREMVLKKALSATGESRT